MNTRMILSALLGFALMTMTTYARGDENRAKANASAAAMETLKIDPNASSIEWLGKKVLGEHNGEVQFKSGEIMVDNGVITGGNFVVDMTTIKNHDIEDADTRAKLVGHLKSDDFFGVDKHPIATFTIEHAKPIEKATGDQPNYRIYGTMHIKGKKNKMGFPARVVMNGNTMTATATMDIDRTKYDVRYGSGSFFDNVGNVLIEDDFTLDLKIVAKKMNSDS